jgi:hypothetical protein
LADLFEEVEEQLRSDRYKALAIKALPWLLALLAVVVIAIVGYWGWEKYRTQTANKASEQYAAALEAAGQGNTAGATSLWTEVSKSPAKAYKSLALMQLAGLKLLDDKQPEAARTQAAVKLFDEAAAAAPDDVIGDAARLKSALALLDTAPYKELETRLTPLMKDGHPYRDQAREALAFAKIMAGNTAGARSDFLILSTSLDASDGARQRAKAAMELIDSGSAKAIPATVKAAALLPPLPTLPPGVAPSEAPAPEGPVQAPQQSAPQ